jgi:hypothetical protein
MTFANRIPTIPRRAGTLALMAALVLSACTSVPPAEPGPGPQRAKPAAAATPDARSAAELRRAAVEEPVPNWFYIPERLLPVGLRAVFETSDGPARYEVEMLSRSGDANAIRLRWTDVPASHAYLTDLVTTYVVDDRSAVRGARIEDTAAKAFHRANRAEPGGPGYVTQPTVMRLPVPELAALSGRSLRIDAVAVVEVRGRDGLSTKIHYLSDDANFGVARVESYPAPVVSVSDVVAAVAAARMSAGQPGSNSVPLSEALAARPGASKARIVTRLIGE